MRIGVNCFSLLPRIGGCRQYFLTLFDELFERDGDNKYVLFYFKHNSEELANLRSSRWKASAVLLSDQTEIYSHCNLIDLYFCPFGFLWPRPLPLPGVVTVADVQEAFYPEFLSPSELHNRAFHHIGSTKLADHVITISNFSKQTIVDLHGVDARKVSVTHLCADARYARALEIAKPPSVDLPPADFLIYPANRWPHKNHDVLLRALAILRDTKRKVNVVFTGYDDPDGYPLVSKAEEYGVRDQVYCSGYVSVPEMAWLYRNARMLVFPSLFEGFGIPLVESMTVGCPVVAARTTSLPEIGGDAVEYCDPTSPEDVAASIGLVLMDGALREQMIAKGKVRAACFSPQRMADLHLEAFRKAKDSYWGGLHHLRRIQHQWLALGNRRRYQRLLAERAKRQPGAA